MWRPWAKHDHWPIGVDVGRRYLKLAQVQADGRGLRLVTAVRELPAALRQQEPPEPAALAEQLAAALASEPFVGREAVSCMPGHLLWQRQLRLVPMTERERRAAVDWQVAQHMGLAVGQFKAQFFEAGESVEGDKRRHELVAVAAPLDGLEQHVAMCRAAHLNLLAIDVAAAALARRFAVGLPAGLAAEGPEPPALILELGYATTTLAVAERDELRFVHAIDLGTQAIWQRLARKLEIPLEQAEALCRVEADEADEAGAERPSAATLGEVARPVIGELGRQIAMSLHHYAQTFRQGRPNVGVVAGDGACQPALVSQLAGAIGVELVGGDQVALQAGGWPVAGMPEPSRQVHCAVASGLSLYPTDGNVERRVA